MHDDKHHTTTPSKPTTASVVAHIRAQPEIPAAWAEELESALIPVIDVDPALWARSVTALRRYGVALPPVPQGMGDASEADMLGYIGTIGTVMERGE